MDFKKCTNTCDLEKAKYIFHMHLHPPPYMAMIQARYEIKVKFHALGNVPVVATLLNIWIVSLEKCDFVTNQKGITATVQPYWIEICTLIAIIGPIFIHNVSKGILSLGDIQRNLVLFKLVKESLLGKKRALKVTLKYLPPDTFQLNSKQTPTFRGTKFWLFLKMIKKPL